MTGIQTIALSMPLGLGVVNAYLLTGQRGQVLVDAGSIYNRETLDRVLADTAHDLRLIALTHGDSDHAGNAAHLRAQRGVPVGMHAGDVPMVERGDMSAGRRRGGCILGPIPTWILGYRKAERFVPDLLLEDGDSLALYGLEARIVHIPGHSTGSIALLTAEGDLFCGDLLENKRLPRLNPIMDDPLAGQASLERLRTLDVRRVYPGHGDSFVLEELA